MELAVWNVMLPSTFCMVWWMCPLRTLTEPKRFRRASAFAPSSVPQPQSAYTVHNGMWANTTIGLGWRSAINQDIHQADEMHAALIEAEPAVAFCVLAESLQVCLSFALQEVVFAWDKELLPYLEFA